MHTCTCTLIWLFQCIHIHCTSITRVILSFYIRLPVELGQMRPLHFAGSPMTHIYLPAPEIPPTLMRLPGVVTRLPLLRPPWTFGYQPDCRDGLAASLIHCERDNAPLACQGMKIWQRVIIYSGYAKVDMVVKYYTLYMFKNFSYSYHISGRILYEILLFTHKNFFQAL